MTDDDTRLTEILTRTRIIACVGASPNPARPSHYVSLFLQAQGYRVIPVNPGQAGNTLFGERAYARLSDIPSVIAVDFVDVFRRSEEVPAVVDEALDALPHLRTIWMQIGVQHADAARRAEAAGVQVVQNRCPKIDIPRLGLLDHRPAL
ncbi:CoA-binding protein [Pseudoruegeria sp. SK021]|uniref:CoA-binding protein n=1 Tax=Pseudoruegeria sp. SK021 TaxID=1933035 RepID=UPI000A22F017|nr:CoA-binding protein [Pseudoruegeria sp. SK021]OSP56445.1 CoA-binding protein [Pseudoruegeria sp. SK021]